MKCFAHRWLPGYFVVFRRRALAAEQVDPQLVADCWRPGINCFPRYSHRAVPDMRLRINTREDFESGVPGPSLFVVRLVQVDIEVNPLALRRYFKFLITLDVLEVGTEEHFRDIPVPKFVGFLLCIRRRLEIQLPVGANEKEVQVVRGPTRADLRAIAGNWFAVRVF